MSRACGGLVPGLNWSGTSPLLACHAMRDPLVSRRVVTKSNLKFHSELHTNMKDGLTSCLTYSQLKREKCKILKEALLAQHDLIPYNACLRSCMGPSIKISERARHNPNFPWLGLDPYDVQSTGPIRGIARPYSCPVLDSDEISRPLANFHPDVWGDRFLDHIPLDEVTRNQMENEAEVLKEAVRQELLAVVKDAKKRLIFLDDIHRLGVAYHFEKEIEDTLHRFHEMQHHNDLYEDELHYVSLRFRLLRQHGFYISSDVFEQFKSENGSFKNYLGSDVQGLFNLYEASHLRFHGEDILDQTLAFATTHLSVLATQVSSPLMRQQITRALKRPLNKRTIRLESRQQISFYESDSSHDKLLLRFAKLDFNLVLDLHKMELKEQIRWSRRLDSIIQLPNLRNRVVEGYLGTLGAYYEPHYSYARILMNKFFKIITIVDDLYDSYGTLEELEPFTDAIERWEKSFTNQLPSYMRPIFQAIVDVFDDLEQDLAKEGQSYAVHYLQQQIKAHCRAFLKEARWCREKYRPTYDEYIENGIITSGYLYVFTASCQGMGDILSKEAFEWINQESKVPRASSIITRLLNDMAGHKIEQTRDHVASAVECYSGASGQFNTITTEEAPYKELLLLVEDEWKHINQGLLRPTIVSMPFLSLAINLTRTLYDFYDIDEDGFTMNDYLQTKVAEALVDPIII